MDSELGSRLFGFIGAGAAVGQLFGSLFTIMNVALKVLSWAFIYNHLSGPLQFLRPSRKFVFSNFWVPVRIL
ncbi:unnamed protein product [Prunus armeniaca]